jgi:hypothetical protein
MVTIQMSGQPVLQALSYLQAPHCTEKHLRESLEWGDTLCGCYMDWGMSRVAGWELLWANCGIHCAIPQKVTKVIWVKFRGRAHSGCQRLSTQGKDRRIMNSRVPCTTGSKIKTYLQLEKREVMWSLRTGELISRRVRHCSSGHFRLSGKNIVGDTSVPRSTENPRDRFISVPFTMWHSYRQDRLLQSSSPFLWGQIDDHIGNEWND